MSSARLDAIFQTKCWSFSFSNLLVIAASINDDAHNEAEKDAYFPTSPPCIRTIGIGAIDIHFTKSLQRDEWSMYTDVQKL
jgi:hypothetical protein